MIDRGAFWITGFFLIIMLAAAFGRIALLPDWTLFPPNGGVTVTHSYRALYLFAQPLWLVIFVGIMAIRGWVTRESRAKLRSWKGWASLMLISGGAIVTMLQLFMVARSLGLVAALSPLAVVRAGFVLIGALLMAAGNQLPKLPWLQSQLGFLQLDNDQGAKLLRFRGRLSVAVGFLVAAEGALLPANLILSILTVTIMGSIAVNLLRTMQTKREQAH